MMNDFPKKLDLFTAFAAQKITKHSKEMTAIGAENISSDHEQLLEEELTNQIHELTCSGEVLLEPSLLILKQYYINLFRSWVHHAV